MTIERLYASANYYTRRRYYVFRPYVRLSVCCPFVNTCFAWRDISVGRRNCDHTPSLFIYLFIYLLHTTRIHSKQTDRHTKPHTHKINHKLLVKVTWAKKKPT